MTKIHILGPCSLVQRAMKSKLHSPVCGKKPVELLQKQPIALDYGSCAWTLKYRQEVIKLRLYYFPDILQICLLGKER